MSEQARQAAQRLLDLSKSGALDALCTAMGIDLMTLFGSACDPESDPGDVDLAVRFRRDVPADLLALHQRLYELTRYEGYDILDLSRAGPVARERALVRCRVLCQSRPGVFANAQIAAIMERLDTTEMRRLELELLVE